MTQGNRLKENRSAGNNAEKLKTLEAKIKRSKALPLYAYRRENGYQVVMGEGNPAARLLLIGEAPGKQEALSGRPFVGMSGRMLDGLLTSIGLDRRQVYITNILKDRPPENRPPQPDEIRQYAPILRRQIEIIQPRVIATLGRFAMQFILAEFDMPEQGGKISDLHGRPLQASASYGQVAVLPLYHPAVALYRRAQKATLEEDFGVLRETI
jgi:uracil-DNA glycosylase family 4